MKYWFLQPCWDTDLTCVDGVRSSLKLQPAAVGGSQHCTRCLGRFVSSTLRPSFATTPSYLIVTLNYSGSLLRCAIVNWAVESVSVSPRTVVCMCVGGNDKDKRSSDVAVESEFATNTGSLWESRAIATEWINEQDLNARFNTRRAHTQATPAGGFIFNSLLMRVWSKLLLQHHGSSSQHQSLRWTWPQVCFRFHAAHSVNQHD